jgi:TRAP-type transport system small permease protein
MNPARRSEPVNGPGKQPPGSGNDEHVLGADGQFHVSDEPIDISVYTFEDWISFIIFWALAFVVFYQVFTRYALNDPAGWTEEIARYMLVAVVFIGASMSVRKNNHIQVDVFYRFMPRWLARTLSTLVDLIRCSFLGYAAWLTWLLMQRIGEQRMAIVELPMGLVFGAMLFGFALMFVRSLQVAWRHWKRGYSMLERPELALEGGEK